MVKINISLSEGILRVVLLKYHVHEHCWYSIVWLKVEMINVIMSFYVCAGAVHVNEGPGRGKEKDAVNVAKEIAVKREVVTGLEAETESTVTEVERGNVIMNLSHPGTVTGTGIVNESHTVVAVVTRDV